VKPLFFAVAAASALAIGAAPAAEIEGVKIPDRVTLGKTELVLNGAGLRTRAFFRVYVGALYLPQKTRSAQAALDEPGARRVAMHMLRDLAAEQLYSALNDGLKANHAPGELAKLEPQVKQLEAIFVAVKAAKTGDVILLDYVPGTGTRVTVNADARGTIPGEAFGRALLRIWLGEQPADAALKKAMLGG
jgi:long-chain acyl-CoA synthetase